MPPFALSALLLPMFLPSWMNVESIIGSTGPWALWVVAVIVFAECGLAVFFMPGDSLLFAIGMFCATGVIAEAGPLIHYGSPAQTLLVVNVVLLLAAWCGNLSGYWIGRAIGPRLFKPREGLMGRVFSEKHLTQTHDFFEHHGSMALILARFVPIVRTFVTMVAGISKMNFRKFISYTALGGLLWVLLAVQAGYFLGQIQMIRDNFERAMLLIIFVSVLPMLIEWYRTKRKDAALADSTREQ